LMNAERTRVCVFPPPPGDALNPNPRGQVREDPGRLTVTPA
jgi:hypothetical protein